MQHVNPPRTMGHASHTQHGIMTHSQHDELYETGAMEVRNRKRNKPRKMCLRFEVKHAMVMLVSKLQFCSFLEFLLNTY